MDYGVLGAYFDGAVAKTLVGVDIMGANKSHQHEFNGVGLCARFSETMT